MQYFPSNTSQLAIEVCFTVSLRLHTLFTPAKLSNETSFTMDSILICTRLLINQKAPC